jgi:hypothetical protein
MNSKAMFFKRSAVSILAATSLLIVLLAVFAPGSAISKAIPFTHPGASNSMSGASGGDGPVLVVKIDDTP